MKNKKVVESFEKLNLVISKSRKLGEDASRRGLQQVDSIKEKAQERKQAIQQVVREQMQTLCNELGLVTRADLNEVEEQLKQLKAAVDSSGSAQSSSAKPAAVSADSEDLKQLRGVGPALEKRLKAAGITRLSQIATPTDEDAAALAKFTSAMDSDTWTDQARELLGAE